MNRWLTVLALSTLAMIVVAVGVRFTLATPPEPSKNPTIAAPKTAPSPSAPPTAVLYFDNYGFDQNDLKVAVGTTVTVKNIATNLPLDFEALPGQPDQNTALNLGSIPMGASKTFVIDRSCVWQYQADNNPELRGIITTAKPNYDTALLPDQQGKEGAVSVVYDDYGFMPNQITVRVGTTIRLRNGTDNTQPGPSHFAESSGDQSKNPALDLGEFQKGQIKQFVIRAKGSWVLQNIDQPLQKALMRITGV